MTQTANMVGISNVPTVGAISIAALREINAFQDQLNADLEDVFFGDREFAESCSYTHAGSGETVSYRVIYDGPSQTVNTGASTESILLQPQIQIPLHQMVQEPSMGDSIKVQGILYKIESYEKDGVGTITIYLVRQTGAIH